jgi:hypothetical protein
MIWKRMILPTGLYACEIWGGLSNTEIDLLERTQRYAARFIQCMDNTSPIDSTISNLGLWSIESVTGCKESVDFSLTFSTHFLFFQ